jgi:hypothetical protein
VSARLLLVDSALGDQDRVGLGDDGQILFQTAGAGAIGAGPGRRASRRAAGPPGALASRLRHVVQQQPGELRIGGRSVQVSRDRQAAPPGSTDQALPAVAAWGFMQLPQKRA